MPGSIEIVRPRIAYLAAKPEVVPAVADVYRVESAAVMVRMSVDRGSFVPFAGEAVRLDTGDTRHLNRLYELGVTSWLPAESVAAGVYFGVRRGTRLIAAAGTHVISPMYGIAAVGNVFTNREYRGQGHAKVVTSAVTAELLNSVCGGASSTCAPTIPRHWRSTVPWATGHTPASMSGSYTAIARSGIASALPIKRLMPTLRRNG